MTGLLSLLAIAKETVQEKTFAAITIFLFGFIAFATVPLLQTRIVLSAKDAPPLASAANISAFNLANAFGAYLGARRFDLAWD